MDSERGTSQQASSFGLLKMDEEGWQNRLITLVRERFEYIFVLFSVVVFVIVWQLIIILGDYPEFILPQPISVWRQFLVVLGDGNLWFHSRYTLGEALTGFAFGLIFATVFGYILGRWPVMEKVISPYLVAAKSVPILGIAPLIIIWFGQGIISKALIAFLIIFFPMLVNTIVGIRSVSEDQRELMRSYSASAWQVFTRLEVPASLPILLGGVRVGLARSMMGAIVGEYLGGSQGLGFLVNMGTGGGVPNAALTFVGIFDIIIITLLLYGSASVFENILLADRRREAQ